MTDKDLNEVLLQLKGSSRRRSTKIIRFVAEKVQTRSNQLHSPVREPPTLQRPKEGEGRDN